MKTKRERERERERETETETETETERQRESETIGKIKTNQQKSYFVHWTMKYASPHPHTKKGDSRTFMDVAELSSPYASSSQL